jgi:deoxyribodipyrimidine photolyase-related protein
MKSINLIFPNQLFEKTFLAKLDSSEFILWEANLFFTQFNFHKNKLILHRSSMKYYQDYLLKNNYSVNYFDFCDYKKLEDIFIYLKNNNYEKINYFYTADYLLERRLLRYSEQYNIILNKLESPNFLTKIDEFNELLNTKNYFFTNFYIKQRKRLDVLLINDKPVGDKWSFDTENRKKLPKNVFIPKNISYENNYTKEAIKYVELNFINNLGEVNFNYPTTHLEAEKHLQYFIENKLSNFGDYEDAISIKEDIIFHSVLTPSLNIGLLTPEQIISNVLDYHSLNPIPLNSLEGFIRQVIGWREFILGIYAKEGVKQRKSNYWNFLRQIPNNFYDGTTGIEPIDYTIKRLSKSAYSHHIERLMILGNFMLLCEISPDEVYRWFMEFYIDAYDWVMVPNVYGMSQYADGGLITTKPYLSSSNYVLKMSDFPKGDWCEVWDGLFWRFIYLNYDKLKGNQRMSMMLRLVEKMDKNKLNKHLKVADEFLEKIF